MSELKSKYNRLLMAADTLYKAWYHLDDVAAWLDGNAERIEIPEWVALALQSGLEQSKKSIILCEEFGFDHRYELVNHGSFE